MKTQLHTERPGQLGAAWFCRPVMAGSGSAFTKHMLVIATSALAFTKHWMLTHPRNFPVNQPEMIHNLLCQLTPQFRQSQTSANRKAKVTVENGGQISSQLILHFSRQAFHTNDDRITSETGTLRYTRFISPAQQPT